MRKGTRSNPMPRRWRGIVWVAVVAALWVPARASAEMEARTTKKSPAQGQDAPAANVVQILGRYGVRPDQVFTWYGAARLNDSSVPCFPLTQRRTDAGRAPAPALSPPAPSAGEHQPAPSAERSRVELVGARGVIQNTFYQSARGAGLPDGVISRMADLLGWEIDFAFDVQTGDRFRVLYEQNPDGTPGRILVADYVGKTRSVAAFLYDDGRTEPIYLDAQGRPLENAFLRYPVEFSRITSSFTDSRLHPILNTRRPHLGVDFAAPVGTPVRAVGTGVVRAAGWKGGFGRHIEIDHGKGLVSTYSHLNAIRGTVRSGAHVKAGDLIGWVGQTGLATGPHLHFAVFRNDVYLNPLTTRWAPPGPAIDRRQFDRVRTVLTAQLRAVFAVPRAASSTPPILLSPFAQARRLGPLSLTI